MNKLKQNDLVVVLAGKDKGKTGEITRILDTTGCLFLASIWSNGTQKVTRRRDSLVGLSKKKRRCISLI